MPHELGQKLAEGFSEQIHGWNPACEGPGKQLTAKRFSSPAHEKISELRQRGGDAAEYFITAYTLQQNTIAAFKKDKGMFTRDKLIEQAGLSTKLRLPRERFGPGTSFCALLARYEIESISAMHLCVFEHLSAPRECDSYLPFLDLFFLLSTKCEGTRVFG
jgi:hypothetical protein